MKQIFPTGIGICLLALMWACQPSERNVEIVPNPAAEGEDEPENVDAPGSDDWRGGTGAGDDRVTNDDRDDPDLSGIRMKIRREAFTPYAIDTENLFYELDFKDDDGESIVSRPKSELDFDATTKTGTINIKIKDGASGIVHLKVFDETDGNDRFEGASDRVTIDGQTTVKISLKRVGDATITIAVTLDDPDLGGGDGDEGSNTEPDPFEGIADAELKRIAQSIGDPKEMGTPTLQDARKVAAQWCVGCHPGSARGDARTEAFYRDTRINAYLAGGSSASMPIPGGPRPQQMNRLASAGFDYRKLLADFAKSLGNNR